MQVYRKRDQYDRDPDYETVVNKRQRVSLMGSARWFDKYILETRIQTICLSLTSLLQQAPYRRLSIGLIQL
jgi:hypothetical protein